MYDKRENSVCVETDLLRLIDSLNVLCRMYIFEPITQFIVKKVKIYVLQTDLNFGFTSCSVGIWRGGTVQRTVVPHI